MKSRDQRLFYKIEQEKNKRAFIEKEGKRNAEPNLKGISDALDEYYIYNKLRIYYGFLSYSIIINSEAISYTKSEIILIDELVRIAENRKEENPLYLIQLNIIYLFKNIENSIARIEIVLDETLELLKLYKDDYSIAERLEIYSLLSNICIYRVNRIHLSYKERLFIINNTLVNLQHDIGDKILATLFENIVITALSMDSPHVFNKIKTHGVLPNDQSNGFENSIEWTEKFIRFNKNKIDTIGKKYHLPYCEALFLFNKKEFLKVYEILKKFQPRGAFIAMNSRILYLKVVYEIIEKGNNSQPQKTHITEKEIQKGIRAYKELIRYQEKDKKLLTYQLEHFNTFYKLYSKLYSLYSKYDGKYNKWDVRFNKEKLKLETLVNAIDFSYKKWFVEKIKDIK